MNKYLERDEIKIDRCGSGILDIGIDFCKGEAVPMCPPPPVPDDSLKGFWGEAIHA